MRKEHFLFPVKWLKQFAQALRLGDVHFKVYVYLESAPDSHATGCFFTTPARVAEMVAADQDEVALALDELHDAGLIQWDAEARVVWVPCMAEEQFRWKGGPKPSDHRVTEARRHIAQLPPSWVVACFLQGWPVFREPDEGASQGASQGAWQGALTVTNTSPSLRAPGAAHAKRPSNQPAAPIGLAPAAMEDEP